MMRRAAFLALALAAWAPAQAASQPASRGASTRVLTTDHLESKGATAWVLETDGGERALLVARLGAEPATRLQDRALRDALLDATGRGAFLLFIDGGVASVAHVVLDSKDGPRTIVSGLEVAEPVLHRAGDEALLVTTDAVIAVPRTGSARELLHRDDPEVTTVVRNDRGTLLATVHGGAVELVDPDGVLRGSLGRGRSPAFVDDDTIAFVRDLSGAPPDGVRRVEIVLADAASARARTGSALEVAGEIEGLREAGDGGVTFVHTPPGGYRQSWLLHASTGIARPIDPADEGRLRRAANASRPVAEPPAPASRGVATPEPETTSSGFFLNDGAAEVRTAYEESGWDDAHHPDEAALLGKLLGRFLDGIQWPFRRSGAYEPFFGPDDEPLRAHSKIAHLGLDVGSRLMHISTGGAAYYVAGTAVYPIFRGGRLLCDRPMQIRDVEPAAAGQRFGVLHEVEIREGPYVLRVHMLYSHVIARSLPATVTGDEPIGVLDSYNDESPSGGWKTSAEALLAAGIGKGNHVHLGVGGVFGSFNAPGEGARRKLRWYQEALIPALRRARAPR